MLRHERLAWASGRVRVAGVDEAGRGPLAGIPILVKDNIATGDGLANSAGSLALATSRPTFSAPVIDNLRKAGAVILGKTNMSEWANFRSGRSSSGWSARGGQCRNPYAPDRTPGGSSSGSAVAVAAGFGPAALGTETNGSIVGPAAMCGIVGLKPTVGLLSTEGVIPIASSFDTVGPMARTVSDVAYLLSVLAGQNYSPRADALKGARLGVARAQFGHDDRVDALIEKQLSVLARQGAVLIDPVEVPADSEYGAHAYQVELYEFKAELDAYLARLGPSSAVKSLADVIAFNEAHHREEMLENFGQQILVQAQSQGPLEEPAYREALEAAHRITRRDGLDKTLSQHRLDAIVAPTITPAWTIDSVNGDHFQGSAAGPAAIAGYPHITVPAGFVQGLPVGLSFYAGPHQEARLLSLAYAFEQSSNARVEPALVWPL